MLDRSLVDTVIARWAASEKTTASSLSHAVDTIHEFIEVTFLASLRREEDRPLRFSVALLDRQGEEGRRNIHATADAYPAFRHPLDFSERSLSKIAPAFDIATSTLAAGCDSAWNGLRIWGVRCHQPPSNRYTGVPIGAGSGLFPYSKPDALIVQAAGPGSLLVSHGEGSLGRISGGSFQAAEPTPFTSRSLGRFLLQALASKPLFHQHQNAYWHVYRDSLEFLLFEAARRGHGSTIALVPEALSLNALSGVCEVKYELGPFGLNKYFEKHLLDRQRRQADALFTLGIENQRIMLERIRALAQMATVDGALVLNDSFDLIGFGGTLRAPPWKGVVVTGPNGWGESRGDEFSYESLGTRHSSAISFAAACPGSVVFVISQDGPIRAFRRSEVDSVWCWPDCTLSMMNEHTPNC